MLAKTGKGKYNATKEKELTALARSPNTSPGKKAGKAARKL